MPGLVRSDYTNDRNFEEFTPRASVSYQFSDELTTYFSYAEGFKSGGFDMRGDVVLKIGRRTPVLSNDVFL